MPSAIDRFTSQEGSGRLGPPKQLIHMRQSVANAKRRVIIFSMSVPDSEAIARHFDIPVYNAPMAPRDKE